MAKVERDCILGTCILSMLNFLSIIMASSYGWECFCSLEMYAAVVRDEVPESASSFKWLMGKWIDRRKQMLKLVNLREKAKWGHQEKVDVCKPRRGRLPKTNLTGTLIVDFQLQELWGNRFLFINQPTCGIFCWQP